MQRASDLLGVLIFSTPINNKIIDHARAAMN